MNSVIILKLKSSAVNQAEASSSNTRASSQAQRELKSLSSFQVHNHSYSLCLSFSAWSRNSFQAFRSVAS